MVFVYEKEMVIGSSISFAPQKNANMFSNESQMLY
jgi:hypothetical protein